jgi:L-seryl-tRNA(Ser) seleniumtransferase
MSVMPPANDNEKKILLRKIPAVDKLLGYPDFGVLSEKYSRGLLLKAVQKRLEKVRQRIVLAQEPVNHDAQEFTVTPGDIEEEISLLIAPLLQQVINATGVVLHTNLGRSILPDEALKQVHTISRSYSNLEYDIPKGARGSRYAPVEDILCEISGAEAAFVVNNNAAAVFLVLNTLSLGKEAIVSRGELIEIGGSFRIPDIMKRSGTVMVEVGTTNKTHLKDFEKVIGDTTGILLKVHTSNYKIIGFTSGVDLPSLVALGKRHHLPVVNDLGSGSLIDLSPYGLDYEPTVQEVVKTGADVVTFSGDKLLGGPQAGIIVGRKTILDQLKKNPLNRALRIDKLTLAALESTLRLYLDQDTVIRKIPTLRMLTITADELERRAVTMRERIQQTIPQSVDIHITDDTSQVGGGALPAQQLPTRVIAISSRTFPVQELERCLRENKPSVIARIHKEQLRIDLRTVLEDEEEALAHALTAVIASLV